MNKELTDWNKYWGHAWQPVPEVDRIDVSDYTSPEVYEREKKKIFRKAWLMVARQSEVAEPGEFIKIDVPTLDTEVVIARGKDGVIRSFYNACPHRGVALVRQCEGKTGLFVCPYHA
ncbi:MAG: hypothetical protein EOP61_13670, partial [Sphingomonadales bacterium]